MPSLKRPRLDGTGTASAGIPASLAGSPVGLDNGGRVTSLSGTNFTYYRYDNRLQSFVTGATTESFAYDALLRTTELLRNGAPVELYLRDDLSDNIAAVSNGTPGLAGLRRRIIWDGVDHPLWMFDADRGVTVYFELDTTGNVRRLHAGERVTGNGAFTGDLGGYSYTAFGRNIPTTEPGGEAVPRIDAVDYVQRLQWQGRWLYNRSGGLYDFRARFWSPQLGAFLQLDQYQFLSSGGTLWSWPGQNPFRWRDPSGRKADVPGYLDWLVDLDDAGYIQPIGDFSAGVSSAVTFGLSDKLIDATGLGKYGDKCSTATTVGKVAGVAVGLGKALAPLYQVPKVVYHFTSRAAAAEIAAKGVIDAGKGLYGAGVYATRWNSALLATVQGARSTEVAIAISTEGGGWVRAPGHRDQRFHGIVITQNGAS